MKKARKDMINACIALTVLIGVVTLFIVMELRVSGDAMAFLMIIGLLVIWNSAMDILRWKHERDRNRVENFHRHE